MPGAAYFGPGAYAQAYKAKMDEQRKIFPFLKLPGEIRNKIYEYAIPATRVIVFGNQPQKELAQQMQSKANIKAAVQARPRYRLRCEVAPDAYSEGEHVQVALFQICRVIHDETMPIVYSKTTFCFDTIKAINKFLNQASKAGQKAICRIEMKHSSYGEPQLFDMREWKIKHDQKWAQVCQRLSNELTSLQRLRLDLQLRDWPTQLNSGAAWAKPLIVLKGNGLDLVNLNLWHDSFHRKRLASAARIMEDLMMTEEGMAMRDMREAMDLIREMEAKEAEKARLPAIRAIKTLVIKNIPPSLISVRKPVVRSKGLEKYTRIDLATANVAFC